MTGRNPAVNMGYPLGDDPEEIRSWMMSGPSDRDLARAYAEVHNHIGGISYEDIPEEVWEDWETLEHQMLYQIARRWLPTQGISWSAGWWIDDGKGKIYETITFPKTRDGDLIVPYATPIGGVCLWVDGEPTVSDAHWEPDCEGDYATCHPVDGNYRLAYRHVPDGRSHVVECRLAPLHGCECNVATGERLVALEVDDGESTVSIGVEWDETGYDYRARVTDFGITIELPAGTGEQWVVFGLAWVEETTEENAANPWLMADPYGDRENVPDGAAH